MCSSAQRTELSRVRGCFLEIGLDAGKRGETCLASTSRQERPTSFAINLRNAIEGTHYDGHCHGLPISTSLFARTGDRIVEARVDSMQQSCFNTSRLPTSNCAATWETAVSVAQYLSHNGDDIYKGGKPFHILMRY